MRKSEIASRLATIEKRHVMDICKRFCEGYGSETIIFEYAGTLTRKQVNAIVAFYHETSRDQYAAAANSYTFLS